MVLINKFASSQCTEMLGDKDKKRCWRLRLLEVTEMNSSFKDYVIIRSVMCAFAKNANVSQCLPNENIIDTVANLAVRRDLLANAVNGTFCRKKRQPLYPGNNLSVVC